MQPNPLVVEAIPREGFLIDLVFANGERGSFDLSPYLERGVFRRLQDPRQFQNLRVVSGSVEWSSGADLSHDTLYLEARKTAA
jgi:hypothetical protein